MKTKGQGWSIIGRLKTVNALFLMSLLFVSSDSFASALTVREISVKENNIEIQLDGITPKGAIDMDYVRDIVQFSIPNATIYPAKIIHADASQSFSKVFAYQYSPNLVRVRFSVGGKAEDFKGKVKWRQNGKSILVSFPEGSIAHQKEEAEEKSLLAKVLNSAKRDENKNVEAISPEEAKAEAKAESKAETKAEAKNENRKLTGNPSSTAKANTKLAGQTTGPSGLRSFMSMVLVIGGLGLTLLFIIKRRAGGQARKIGDSWMSNLFGGMLPNSMKKQKAFIEVVATHSLGPKHSITVVKIKGQQFVLAITPENVQMITQLDSDEDLDVMEDPKVAASLGRMFGGKTPLASPALNPSPSIQTNASFDSLLKSSNGVGAIVARNAYAAQGLTQNVPAIEAQKNLIQNTAAQSNIAQSNTAQANPGVRDQIRKRLEGMKNA